MDRETQCLQAGADGFILKPFRPTHLIERIKKMMA
jgi:DNA-binding response OmpR family regulator